MRMAANAGPFARYCVANRFRCTASLRALLLILHKITSLPYSFDYLDRLLDLICPERVSAISCQAQQFSRYRSCDGWQ